MPTVSELVSKRIGNTITNSQTWDIFYNAKEYGAVGNGVANDYSALSTLINTTINGANATIIFPRGTYKISTNLTFPSNISLYFVKGAMLSPDSGITITINGATEAGLWQIFTGSGTVSGFGNVEALHPHWWGAKFDESQDDKAAIQKTFDASPALHGVVKLPPGRALISGNITATNKNIQIIGSGRNVTRLRFTAAGGIVFTTTDILNELTIKDMSLMADIATNGVAISGTWPDTLSGQNPTCLIENVSMYSTTPGVSYWTQGIKLTEAWNAIVRGCSVKGDLTGTTRAISAEGMCGDIVITANHIWTVTTGIYVTGDTEGPQINNNSMVGVTNGIIIIPTTIGKPGTSITNNHMSASERGIQASEAVQIYIGGNLIYKSGNGNFVGIDLINDADDCRVVGNLIIKVGTPTGTTTGIAATSADRSLISNNATVDMDTCISVGALTDIALIIGNHRSGGTTTISNSGTNIIIRENFPTDNTGGIVIFTANDTTPSVTNSQTNSFQTANTLATTINMFDDGYVGQIITVLANDANTTIGHFTGGGSISLQGAVNFVMGNGAIITLRKDISVWREVSRRTA